MSGYSNSFKNIKLNFLDHLFLLVVLFSLTGYLFARAEKSQLNKIIKGKEKIVIEVYIPDVVAEKKDFFKVGDKSAITIRNRPYTKLDIINIKTESKQLVIPAQAGAYKVIDDPTKLNVHNYYISLTDNALETDDGYVIGGNKIKIGNQIELEGFNYRVSGKVVGIYSFKDGK